MWDSVGYYQIGVEAKMNYIKDMGYLKANSEVSMPDYSIRETRTHGTSYTADQDGWLYIYARGGDTDAGLNTTLTINEVDYPLAYRHNSYGGSASSLCIPIKKGDSYRTSGNCEYVRLYFLPMRNT